MLGPTAHRSSVAAERSSTMARAFRSPRSGPGRRFVFFGVRVRGLVCVHLMPAVMTVVIALVRRRRESIQH